jgi:uncharacterized protein (DUF58 family)
MSIPIFIIVSISIIGITINIPSIIRSSIRTLSILILFVVLVLLLLILVLLLLLLLLILVLSLVFVTNRSNLCPTTLVSSCHPKEVRREVSVKNPANLSPPSLCRVVIPKRCGER